MSEQQILAAGRRSSEARMQSLCTITRDGDKHLDPVTLEEVDVDVTVYTGRCRVKATSSVVSDKLSAGQALVDQDQVLYVPVDGTEAVHINDVVTITDGGPDDGLNGRTFRVTGLFTQTWATARRLPIESITA